MRSACSSAENSRPPRAGTFFARCVNALDPKPAIAERILGKRYVEQHTDRVAESMDEDTKNQADQAPATANAPNASGNGPRVSSAESIAKSSAAGVLSQVLYLTTRFLLTPFVLASVGLEAYGFWSILFVALGWFGLHRMGFASSAISYVARYRSEGRYDRVNAVLGRTDNWLCYHHFINFFSLQREHLQLT